MMMEQESEWIEAQKISISEDLVAAAKRQLEFLGAVDRNRWLYHGPALPWIIYRYNACWLPLLARHSESPVSEGPLVVPLDCEWVWHCHRLNPVRYKSDCEEFYGRILDNRNVVSSVQGLSRMETETVWNKFYPEEQYEFDPTRAFSSKSLEVHGIDGKFTKYNLVLAIERQSPFFYQVSRPHVKNDLFLEEAVARYKGFLHLIKRNRERSIKQFTVPTYDVDLIWHSHQLHPVSYCKDLVEVLGKVLEHDDTDSDRGKGKKLDVGFSETTKQWEETFGSRYWRAGAMYRGAGPSPLMISPFTSGIMTKGVGSTDVYKNILNLPEAKIVEVLLEFVEIRNLPESHKGRVCVLFSKAQPDGIFDVKRRLNIFSESGEKQVALFQCQPTGYLFFELSSQTPNLQISRQAKTLGSSFISLEEFLAPVSKLYVEKWLELVPSSGTISSKPISVRVAVSFTVPIPAPHSLQMARSRPSLKDTCFFPLPSKVHYAKSWTRVIDEAGNEVISFQMRDFKPAKGMDGKMPRKEVISVTGSGERHTLAQFWGTEWSLLDSRWFLKLQKSIDKDGQLELTGPRLVKLVPGRKLEYEVMHCEKRRTEQDFMTAVEFSAENPYGRAIALLDLKSELFKVQEEWFALPGIILAFIISNIVRKEGYNGLTYNGETENLKEREIPIQEANVHAEAPKANLTTSEKEASLNVVATEKVGACDGECNNGCVNQLESGGCGGCGGSGCGNMVKSGGCGGCGAGGCGGGCGNMVKSGGCGGCGAGGCGGGCGNMIKSGGCGGGCGSGCGGGCGNMVRSGGDAAVVVPVGNR